MVGLLTPQMLPGMPPGPTPVVFNERSLGLLAQVNPALRELMLRTEAEADRRGIDMEISEGLRSRERQAQMVAEGRSQTMNSRHLTGNAVDIHLRNPDGTANWDFDAYRPIAEIARQQAAAMGIPDFVWGGDWRTLRDGVHFQIGGPAVAPLSDTTEGTMAQSAATGNAGLVPSMSAMNAPQPQGLFARLAGENPNNPIFGLLADPDRRARLAIGLQGMTLNPNEAFIQTLVQGMQDRRQERELQRAAEFLFGMGRADLAEAVQAGTLAPSAATAIALTPPEAPALVEVNGQLVDPTTGAVIGDYRDPPTQQAPEAPTTQVFWDEATGQEYRAQWNPQTGQWERVGGLAAASGADAPSAAEAKIARIMELGYDRETAIRIADLTEVFVDPMTNRPYLVDRATGNPIGGPQAPQGGPLAPLGAAPAPMAPPAAGAPEAPSGAATGATPGLSYWGDAPPPAQGAFGAAGFGANLANTVADVAGMGQPFPGVSQSVADYRLLNERLLMDLSNAYDRQPPAAIMNRIAALLPNPASVFTGPGAALDQYDALARYLQDEIFSAETALSTLNLPPETVAQRQQQIAGLRAALGQIEGAITGLRAQADDTQGAEITPEEEALIQRYLGDQ